MYNVYIDQLKVDDRLNHNFRKQTMNKCEVLPTDNWRIVVLLWSLHGWLPLSMFCQSVKFYLFVETINTTIPSTSAAQSENQFY